MNFILDGMLGKLTRWLRMMGHDAKYSTVLDDAELLAVAKKEQRVLLTRDFALFQQATVRGISVYCVEGNTGPERLAELYGRFRIPLEIDLAVSRCPKCNTNLASVPKDEITNQVQKNTLLHYNEFWRCPNCGAVYWQGAHWIKIRATLQEAKEKVKER
ncbi:MAG: Mut7-C RNAse domain-containing protein [Candidatus Bathyarchaeota archaeon]|nr:Mut7-C RNAse domain-containing protein [Candidatus Bathyarchaeota archaeon]